MSENTTNAMLKAFVQRYERLEEDIKVLNEDKRDLLAEVKGNGFDTKAFKTVVGMRRKDIGAVKEQNAIVALYLDALGMFDLAQGVEESTPDVAGAPAPARARTREPKPPTELQRRYGMGDQA